MKLKSLLTLSLLTWAGTAVFAQNQLALNPKPNFYLASHIRKTFGLTASIPNYGVAMIVNTANKEFGVTLIDDNTKQLWQVEMEGHPLTVSNYKGNVIVIYSADKTFFGGVKNEYSAKILDSKTGKTIKEQKIYEGSLDYNEDPEFYFAEDQGRFTLISRETNLKKGLKVHLNPFKDPYSSIKEKLESTRNYAILSFDENLKSSNIVTPKFYQGQSFKHFLTESGNIVFAHHNSVDKQILFDLYDHTQDKPTAQATLKLNDAKNFNEITTLIKYDTQNKSYYLSVFYETTGKSKKLIVGKINFETGKTETKEELIDKDVFNSWSKNYTPVNKKLDDFKLGNYYYLNLADLEIVNHKIVVELTSSFVEISRSNITYTSQSSLLKFFDENLGFKFQTIFPRFLYGASDDLASLSFLANGNTATIIGNTKNGQISYTPVYMKVDLNSGTILSYDKLPNQHIDDKFYIRTKNLRKFNNDKVLLTYTERYGGLKSKYDTILQVIGTK